VPLSEQLNFMFSSCQTLMVYKNIKNWFLNFNIHKIFMNNFILSYSQRTCNLNKSFSFS